MVCIVQYGVWDGMEVPYSLSGRMKKVAFGWPLGQAAKSRLEVKPSVLKSLSYRFVVQYLAICRTFKYDKILSYLSDNLYSNILFNLLKFKFVVHVLQITEYDKILSRCTTKLHCTLGFTHLRLFAACPCSMREFQYI